MTKRKQLTCNSFVFYGSFYEAISVLPLENQAHIYDAIFKFAFENIEVDLDGIELAVFLLIKPQLIANKAKYENGCKGGRPRKNETETEANENQKESGKNGNSDDTETEIKPKQNLSETKPKPNENDNVNENYIAAKLNNNIFNKNEGASAYACEADENVQNSLSNFRFICEVTYKDAGVVDRVLEALHANGYAYDLETISKNLFGTLIERVGQTNPHDINAYVKKIVEYEIGRND